MIMIAYYAITALLLFLLGWNFVREKEEPPATSSSTCWS